MDPATVALIASALVKYGPAVARQLAGLFSKQSVTLEDWEQVFALAEKSYDDYVKSPASVGPIPPPPSLGREPGSG